MTYRVEQFPGIHLPGSIPLDNADAVFEWVGRDLSRWTRRGPDG